MWPALAIEDLELFVAINKCETYGTTFLTLGECRKGGMEILKIPPGGWWGAGGRSIIKFIVQFENIIAFITNGCDMRLLSAYIVAPEPDSVKGGNTGNRG